MLPRTTQTNVELAIEKITAERHKALNEAKAIVHRNDRDELLFLMIHQKHLMRVTRVVKAKQFHSGEKALMSLAEDAFAYAVQFVYKYGRRGNTVRLDDYYRLIKISRFVNNGFEMETMLRYFPFQQFGDRLQHFKIYLGGVLADENKSRIFDYAARQEMDSFLRQVNWPVEKLIGELFPPSMDPEFGQVFGLNVQDVTDFYSALVAEVSSKLSQAAQLMPQIAPDRIDVTSGESFRVARFAYTIDYETFLSQFGTRKQSFRTFLLKQALRRSDVNEFELRYFAIWRRHILRLDRRHFTFSPEITMSSPNFGLHYALLEDPRTKDSYQAKRAAQFQSRVESSLVASDLHIIARNIDAKLGKRELGDVDILAEDSNYYFNIECKGAVLPLRVYFHDFDYIRDIHLPYLRDTKGWEKKVVARQEWLNANRDQLELTGIKPLTSLIISDNPEILSHYANTLCLSLHEFPLWYSAVKEQRRMIAFSEFQEQILRKKMAPPKNLQSEMNEYLGIYFDSDHSSSTLDPNI